MHRPVTAHDKSRGVIFSRLGPWGPLCKWWPLYRDVSRAPWDHLWGMSEHGVDTSVNLLKSASLHVLLLLLFYSSFFSTSTATHKSMTVCEPWPQTNKSDQRQWVAGSGFSTGLPVSKSDSFPHAATCPWNISQWKTRHPGWQWAWGLTDDRCLDLKGLGSGWRDGTRSSSGRWHYKKAWHQICLFSLAAFRIFSFCLMFCTMSFS